ncbi:MAG TPA: nitrilase-related carbon-nitrogen hydrolase, partial [Chitinispirillaceae bacterium]|nr:nitrilase-related carbon-nitrogen hydrolase [Chitinispirillaceae bacterium]
AAISQGQNINSSYNAYGHSMVVSPWGDILVEGGSGEELLIADINPELLEVTRNRLPLWQHRRKDLYS